MNTNIKRISISIILLSTILFLSSVNAAEWELESLYSDGNTGLNSIWGSSETNIYAVGNEGTILKYDGANWSSDTSSTSKTLNGIWGSGKSNIYAVGEEGTILYCNGTNWSSVTSGTSNTLYAIWGSDESHIYAAGEEGTILK